MATRKITCTLGLAVLLALVGCGSSTDDTSPLPAEPPSLCGNGAIDTNEACDDGNLAAHDGCSDTCGLELASWQIASQVGPALALTTMAFDVARGRAVLFGGVDESWENYSDTTFEWDGTAWEEKHLPGPAAGYGGALAYDGARQELIYFGGGNDVSIYNQTWRYDGVTWELAANDGPSLRWDPVMAYDEARARIVLFGGFDQQYNFLNDTWEWDGVQWEKVSSLGPSGRLYPAMAYDGTRQRIALVGGVGLDSEGFSEYSLRETWTWDGAQWRQDAELLPAPSGGLGLAYHAAAGQLVAVGGYAADPGVNTPYPNQHNNTWLWDGSQWLDGAPMPVAILGSHLVYDPANRKIIQFGGLNSGTTTRTFSYEAAP